MAEHKNPKHLLLLSTNIVRRTATPVNVSPTSARGVLLLELLDLFGKLLLLLGIFVMLVDKLLVDPRHL
jgi:hypothetical protein